MSVIHLEGMHFYAHHGYHKEEQVLGGQYIVDIWLKTNLKEAAQRDKLNKTIDYEDIYQLVKEEMEVKANLIEHLCHRILRRIFVLYRSIDWMKVRVSKLNPPLKGNVDRVSVDLEEQR